MADSTERTIGNLGSEQRIRSIQSGEELQGRPLGEIVEYAGNVLHFALEGRSSEEIATVGHRIIEVLRHMIAEQEPVEQKSVEQLSSHADDVY
ncbi:hypothetical protein COU91_02975 [Candidatus Saccharibacteria bacterium CG10_big_fil_rev_8_21_14_0_10_47_8]|nr:MAG: hypothetical protein COU91_02975 [Candidatus Saccharibacteria bacterium CG10_big_fil_rev_8_21_14_0_10_47_8]